MNLFETSSNTNHFEIHENPQEENFFSENNVVQVLTNENDNFHLNKGIYNSSLASRTKVKQLQGSNFA